VPPVAPRGLRLALVLAAFAVLVVAAPARADGDPASDVLYFGTVFLPYSVPVGKIERQRLESVVAAARRAGFPIKVALIAKPDDLGGP
jgi:hypothetical protein